MNEQKCSFYREHCSGGEALALRPGGDPGRWKSFSNLDVGERPTLPRTGAASPFGHAMQAILERCRRESTEGVLRLRMVRPREANFIALGKQLYVWLHSELSANGLSQLQDRHRNCGPDIEDFAVGARHKGARHDRRDQIAYIGKRALLPAITEDRKGLLQQEAIHEDPDNVAVPVPDILKLAVNVVRPEDRIRQAKLFVGRLEIQLNRQFGDTVRILGMRYGRLQHWYLSGSVDGDGTCKDETLNAVPYGGIDQVDTANQVVGVVEAANKRT